MTSARNSDSRRLRKQNEQLRRRLAEAEETLEAIRGGDVDAVVVNGARGQKIYSLQDTENLYRRFAETVREPMVALNPDGTIVFYNHCLENLLAHPSGDLAGRKMREVVWSADRAKLDLLLRQIKSRGPSRGRIRLVAADGQAVPIYWQGNLLKRHEGKLVCLVGTDLTQLEASREHAEGLEAQKAELLAIQKELEVASQLPKENPSPVLRLNQGRVISFFNPAAEQLLKRWKVSLGDKAPTKITKAAADCLKKNVRIALEHSIGSHVYQIVFAPVRKGHYVNLYFSDITERKRSEHALQESESRFRTLASHAPVGIFMSKENGETIYVNKKWCQMAGLSAEQSLGKGWLKAVHPEDRKALTAGWERAVGQSSSSSAEFRFQRPNGVISWIHGQATRLPETTGGDIGYIGTTADITERKRAEEELREANELLEKRVHGRTRELTKANAELRTEIFARRKADLALRESEQRLRLMIEGTHDYAFFMLDKKGRVATWNSGAEEIKGYRAKEILGKHFSRFYTPGDVRTRKPHWLLEIARATGRAEDEGWRVHKNGAPFWASVIVSALRDSRGRLRGFLNVTRDITEQRKMQEVLETSRLSLENFFEESPFGLFWVSPKGEIERVNKAGIELLGCRRNECLNQPMEKFWVDGRFAALALSQLRNGQALQSHRARLRATTGEIRHVLIDANGWREGGRLLHTRWFVRDISRRVELEREILAVAESERRRIGRDLHDDLCQQLTGLEFLSQTLAARLRKDAALDTDLGVRADEISRTIRIAITHARDLSHGLAPSVLDSGGLHTALEELAQRTRKVFRINCSFRGRKANINFEEGSDIHLYRIAQEAVGNAIKHGKAKRIDIGLTQNGSDVVLAVKDFGVGLPAKPSNNKGIGLRMMQYRAGVIGGTLLVQRNSNEGTTVVCTVHGSRRGRDAEALSESAPPADADL